MSELEKLRFAQAKYIAALAELSKTKPQNFVAYFGAKQHRHGVMFDIASHRLTIWQRGKTENSVWFGFTEGQELLAILKKLYEVKEPIDEPKA
jgi:hypothetical protein